MAGVARPLHICAFVVATASRDENGRERSGKPFNHSRNHIFLSGTEKGTGTPDGNTKPILRDIGNGIIRSGISRLRSGIKNSKRKHHHMLPFQTFSSTK